MSTGVEDLGTAPLAATAPLATAPLAAAPPLAAATALQSPGASRGREAQPLRRTALAARWLTLADAFAAVGAVLIVALPSAAAQESPGAMLAATLVFVVASVGVARALGLHDTGARISHSTVDDLARVSAVVTSASWLYLVALDMLGLPPLRATTMLAFWGASFAFFVVARALAGARCRAEPGFAQPTLIVGAGTVGQLVARKLQHHPEYGLRLEGFVDDQPRERRADLDELTVLGGLDELPSLVEEHGIERVVVAFSDAPELRVVEVLRALIAAGVSVDIVPRLFGLIGPGVGVDEVEGLHLVSLQPRARSQGYAWTKRAVDVVGALLGLLLTAPLLLFIAVWIKLDSPGPILFRQRRLGMHMREFTSLKFRTMRSGTSSDAHREYIRATAMGRPTRPEAGLFKLSRRDAVTDVGRWLRRTSLDELPQLINVLRGEMSLVGPRPCIPYEAECFAPHHFERFSVPQGVTGLWQVTARAHATFAEALDFDVAYARSCSFWLDLKLILLTPLQMLGLGATR